MLLVHIVSLFFNYLLDSIDKVTLLYVIHSSYYISPMIAWTVLIMLDLVSIIYHECSDLEYNIYLCVYNKHYVT